MGISRNYNSKFPGYAMPERYMQTFDEAKEPLWDFSQGPRPDLTVIYLGGNDFSVSLQPKLSDYKKRYMQLLAQVKAAYGEDHPVLCVAALNEGLLDYVREVCEDSGLKNVSYTGFISGIHNFEDELGASHHPNYLGHQKLAYSIIPYISTITGWELSGAPVK